MINKVTLLGRLGQDPEIKYTPSGAAVATFSMATSESWKDKDTGEKVEKTEWHRCVAWNRLAEICGEYLQKGKLIYVEGSIHTRSWETEEGEKKYATDIKIRQMKMMPGGGRDSDEYRQGGAYEPPGTGAPDSAPGPGDDDIPF